MSVARHTAYNLIGSILPIGVTLVTVPLYLAVIGLERYGVLALVWVLAGYFAFFDFGIGRATARKMATLAESGSAARNGLFWTSAAITGALALLAAITFWPAASLFVRSMDIPVVIRPELFAAIPLIIIAIPTGILQSLLGGVLEGRRAFAELNTLGVFGSLLTALLPLATAHIIGPSLPNLITATLVARGFYLLALLIICVRKVPIGKPEKSDRAEIRELFAFGGWATLTGIVGPVLVYFDRYAIGAWIGAAAVGFYVIGYNLIAQLQIIPSAFSRAIFPRLAEVEPGDSLSLGVDAMWVMAALVTPMAIFAIFAIEPFLFLWIGEKVAKTTGPVAVLLFFGFWSNSIAFVAFARIQASGRPDLAAKVHMAELLPYALLLYLGIKYAGLAGAAAVWSIRCTADFLLLAHLAGLLRTTWSRIAYGGIFVAASGFIASEIDNLVIRFSIGACLLTISLIWCWIIVPTHLRNRIMGVFRFKLGVRGNP